MCLICMLTVRCRCAHHIRYQCTSLQSDRICSLAMHRGVQFFNLSSGSDVQSNNELHRCRMISMRDPAVPLTHECIVAHD